MDKLRRWIATGGFWSMSDQAVVSLGNFLLTVMLARSFSKVEYGTYVVLYGVLQTAHSLHAALISYPISVFGAHRSRQELRAFSANSLIVTTLLDAPVAVVLIVVAWIITRRSDLLLFVIAAMLCWQLQETLRRSLMSHLRHRRALLGDTVTYAGQVVLTYWMVRHARPLTATVGFDAIMIGSLAGAVLHAQALRLEAPNLRDSLHLAKQYFTLGRYPLLSSLAYAGSLLLLPWALAFKGLAEVASYQAMLNVVQVVNPVMFSVGNLVIPAVAHELLKPDGEAKARRVSYRYMLEGVALLGPLFLILLVAPGTIMGSVYGHTSGYTEHAVLLRVLVVAACAIYAGHVLQSYFLGKKQVALVAKSQFFASGTVVLCGFLLIPSFGITGAVIGYLMMGVVRSGALLLALRRDSKRVATVEPYLISTD